MWKFSLSLVTVLRMIHRAESVLKALNNVHSEKITASFCSFLQQLKSKNLSPSGHAWYSSVTQVALPLRMKPNQGRIQGRLIGATAPPETSESNFFTMIWKIQKTAFAI